MLPPRFSRHPHAPTIEQVVRAALARVEPRACIQRHLRIESETLRIDDLRVPLPQRGRIRIFGAGKASVGLTRALLDVLGDRVTDGLVIAKHEISTDLGPVTLRTGGHPLPDQRSVAATHEIVERLRDSRPEDLVLCPISGGASALLTMPREIDLEQLRANTRALLAGGEPIHVINDRRRGWDSIKAGGLARAAAPARVIGLLLSDVVGDPPRYIGSGPTVEDGATTRVDNVIVGRNADAREAAASAARALGLDVGQHREALVGEARAAGRRLGRILARAGDGFPVARPGVLIAGGETTVTVRGPGRGGRNQELGVAAIPPLAGARQTVLVTLGTDGEDGPTPAAGAIVTGESAQRADAMGLDPIEYLNRNDSYAFLDRMGNLLTTGPTGTNVGDLALGFVF